MNEDVVSSSRVRSQLAKFGLIYKDPERLEDGNRVLGLNVRQEQGTLKWGRRTAVPEVPDVFMRQAVFSLYGKLVGHLPVCGWTCAVTGTIKMRASAVTKGWDDETTDDLLVHMVKETIARVKQDDPAKGDWCVQGDELNVWVDASSLAIGVL